MEPSPDPQVLGDKYRGAMLGVAIGDALGAAFEGHPEVDPERLEPLLTDPDDKLYYTDDTAMTIGVAQSLLACDGFDGRHLADTFFRNYRAEPYRGYGSGPPRLFQRLDEGVPWDVASREQFDGKGSFGNGSAMRIAPAALFAYPDLDLVATLGSETSSVTHAHPLGMDGGSVQALAVACALGTDPGTPLDHEAILAEISSRASTLGFREALETVASLLPNGEPEAAVLALGHGIAAVQAVPIAIFAALQRTGSFIDTVLFAISLGGDTDTIASMAGAIAGAHLGASAIPDVWIDRIERHPVLEELASALFARSLARFGIPPGLVPPSAGSDGRS